MIHTTAVGAATVNVLGVANMERTPEEVARLFGDVPGASVRDAVPHPVTWSFNLLLVRFGDHVVLVDTGFGFTDGGPGSATRDLLKECGVGPADVNTVIITHCHGDHVGGLRSGDARSFPNARLVISAVEHAFWTGSASDAMGSQRVDPVRSALREYEGAITTVSPGADLVSDADVTIRGIDAPGHTPGHTGVEIASGTAKLRALVDTLHAEVQFQHPDWSPRFDTDPGTAASTRKRLLAEAAALSADSTTLYHFYHLPFPGIGRVERSGEAFRWVPAFTSHRGGWS